MPARGSSEKLRIRDLGYSIGGAWILSGVDAAASEGLVTAIVGPSGAGKSTLLRTINRLIEPTSGEIYLDGEPTSQMDPLLLRRRVGMVFQLPALFGDTVEEAILYGARLSGDESDTDAESLLRRVGLDGSFHGRTPRSLSVGQQQRVSVARSLALRPQVLLMDEPTSSLDEAARRGMERLIRELVEGQGPTVILVSHDLDQVRRVADSVILLSGGRSVGQWPTREFFSEEAKEARKLVSEGA
ncbi:MAG: phosphate ABC transporter ATP-binding protein [Rubrobacteraceae bacterium]